MRQVSTACRDVVEERSLRVARCIPALSLSDFEVTTTREYVQRYSKVAPGMVSGPLDADMVANKTRMSLAKISERGMYSIENNIVLNPCLQPASEKVISRREQMMGLEMYTLYLPVARSTVVTKAVRPRLAEYISEPPISTPGMRMQTKGNAVRSSCVLRVDTGIKVSDIYETYESMLNAEETYVDLDIPHWQRSKMSCCGLITFNVCSDTVAIITNY